MKRVAYHGDAGKRARLMKLMAFLLFLFLFSSYIISLSCEKGGARYGGASGAAEIVDKAERDLSTFNLTIAAVVLVCGSLCIIYCVRRSSKTGRRRKSGDRLTRQGRP